MERLKSSMAEKNKLLKEVSCKLQRLVSFLLTSVLVLGGSNRNFSNTYIFSNTYFYDILL